jgi:hypothetical protein
MQSFRAIIIQGKRIERISGVWPRVKQGGFTSIKSLDVDGLSPLILATK